MSPPAPGPPGPVAGASASLFEALSRLRRKRIFHPHGVAFAATLSPLGENDVGAPVLERESEGIARLSRSVGLPEWLPDPCGIGLRIPDAYGPGEHQDILMVSSARAALARHAILPARGFLDRPYSTLLPYRLRGDLVLFGARARGAHGPGPKLAELRQREVAGLEFDFGMTSLGGEWRPLAKVTLGERISPERSERLNLDPTNTGGGLELAGPLNRLRGPSYAGSQTGRAAACGCASRWSSTRRGASSPTRPAYRVRGWATAT